MTEAPVAPPAPVRLLWPDTLKELRIHLRIGAVQARGRWVSEWLESGLFCSMRYDLRDGVFRHELRLAREGPVVDPVAWEGEVAATVAGMELGPWRRLKTDPAKQTARFLERFLLELVKAREACADCGARIPPDVEHDHPRCDRCAREAGARELALQQHTLL